MPASISMSTRGKMCYPFDSTDTWQASEGLSLPPSLAEADVVCLRLEQARRMAEEAGVVVSILRSPQAAAEEAQQPELTTEPSEVAEG